MVKTTNIISLDTIQSIKLKNIYLKIEFEELVKNKNLEIDKKSKKPMPNIAPSGNGLTYFSKFN